MGGGDTSPPLGVRWGGVPPILDNPAMYCIAVSLCSQEFMLATNASEANTTEEKLRWAFRLYDKDSSGGTHNMMRKHLYCRSVCVSKCMSSLMSECVRVCVNVSKCVISKCMCE